MLENGAFMAVFVRRGVRCACGTFLVRGGLVSRFKSHGDAERDLGSC